MNITTPRIKVPNRAVFLVLINFPAQYPKSVTAPVFSYNIISMPNNAITMSSH